VLKIGLDLDGVVFQWLPTTQRIFSSIPSNPDRTDVSSYLKTKVEKDAFESLLKDPKYMSGLPLFPDIQTQLVPYLRNHEVYIISNREEAVHRASEERVREVGIDPVEFRWASHGKKFEELGGVDCLVEDLPHNLKGIPWTFPVLMPLRSYNRKYLDSEKHNLRKLYPYTRVDEMINVLEVLSDQGVLHGRG
jgi:hypothetical protein